MWRRKRDKQEEDSAAVDRLRDAVKVERRQRFADLLERPEHEPSHAASDAPEIHERALAQMKSEVVQMPRPTAPDSVHALTERVRVLQDTCRRLEETVAQLGAEVQRVSAASNGVSILTPPGPHEPRRSIASRPSEDAPKPRSIAPQEPAFQPGERAVSILVDGVPDFHALMEIQRALAALLEAESANVLEYQDGQASFEIQLCRPATPAQIVDGLREIGGHDLLIEEAKPQAASMRLRFRETGVAPEPVS